MDKLKPGLTTITLLHYNRIRDLQLCLDSILRNTASPFEIILVDNGSTAPEAKDYVRSLKYVMLIDLPENIVPEAASAMSIPIASGEYIVGISDDIIVTPGWLETFLAHLAKQPHIGLIGPRSNFVSGPQMVTGIKYKDVWELEKFACEWAARNTGRLTPYSRLVGFCWCCHRRVIDKIGYLDPSFGFGFSDDDFSIRANLAGFKTAIAQDVFIHHTGGPQGKGDSKHQKLLSEAWATFKAKWGLPKDLPLSDYHPKALLNRSFVPERDYIPLPRLDEVEPFIYRRAGPNSFVSTGVHANYSEPRIHDVSADLAPAMAPALAAYYLGRMDEAVDLFRGLSIRYDKSFQVHLGLGCSLARQGRMEEAVTPLRCAMELEPNSCKPGNALGRALLNLGRADEAEKAFKKADSVSLYSHQAKFNLIRYYFENGKINDAVDIAREAYGREPTNGDVVIHLAYLLISSARTDEAIEYLDLYLSRSGPNMKALLLLFWAYCEKRDSSRAQNVLINIRSLAEKDKSISAQLSNLLGHQHAKAQNRDAFHIVLKEAKSLFHNLPRQDDFCLDFLVEGDILEAIYEHAKSLYEQNAKEEAFALYKKLNSLAPDHASVHNDLGAILWERGDINGALAHMYQAWKLNSLDKDIVWNLGQALLTLGRTEEARKLFQNYVDMNPDDSEMKGEVARISSPNASPAVGTTQSPISKADQYTLPENTESKHVYTFTRKAKKINFSIIIPTYNRPQLLQFTLESLRRQSYKEFKVYLFDNGSQPPVKVTKLPSDIDIEFSRVEKNSKADSIISEIISQVDGTHLVLFADDDVLLPHTLEIIAHIFREYAEVQLLSTAFSEFDHELCQPLTHFDRLQKFSGSLIRFNAFKFVMKCCAVWGIGNDFEYHIPRSHSSASFLSIDVVRKTLKRQRQLLVLPFGDVGLLGCNLNTKYNHYLDLPLVVLGESAKKEMHGSKLGNRKHWDKYKDDLKFSPAKAVSFPNMELESHLRVLHLNGMDKVLDLSIHPHWYLAHMLDILADDPWTPESEEDLNEAIPLTIESLIKHHGITREKAQAYLEKWIHEQKARLKMNKEDHKKSKQAPSESFTRHFANINDFARWQEEAFIIPKVKKLYRWEEKHFRTPHDHIEANSVVN